MLQAASQDRGLSELIRKLAEEPERLARGLKVLDAGLRLTPELVLDLILKDSAARPWIVLGEEDGDPTALLGRAMCILAEVRRMKDLLERLFRQEGVSFAEGPRIILLARRFSDAFHSMAGPLQGLAVELVEARVISLEGKERLVVVRAGGTPQRDVPPAADRSSSAAVNGAERVASPPASVDARRANGTLSAPAVALNGGSSVNAEPPPPRAPAVILSLVDEAKKKILRVSDDVEEEVDGDVVRFRVHDELLALLEAGPSCATITIGDEPEHRRELHDRNDLNDAIDDVVRRFFTLTRTRTGRPTATVPAGAALVAGRATPH